MTKLFNEVSKLVEKEYDRAEKQHGPTFNSAHESYAVIKEELDEARDEMISAELHTERYWKAVKADNEDTQRDNLIHLRTKSILAACEAIQTAAMAHKAIVTINTTGSNNAQGEF